MRLRQIALSCLALAASTQVGQACIIVPDERTPDQIRADSAPVATDKFCRVINGGVHDTLTLGPAEALGNGRFQQVLGGDQTRVYVGDCNTREATLLLGATLETFNTSCGISSTYTDLAGPNAMMSLAEGENLHELVAIAEAKGARELNPLTVFFEFTYPWQAKPSYPVGDKDRFDLMCGCKRFYPDTPGGAQ